MHTADHGAAASLTSSLMRALFTRRRPDPAHREMVNRCLREKGYEPSRWQ